MSGSTTTSSDVQLAMAAMRQKVDALLKKHMDHMSPSTELTEACRYAVLGEGKRLRPILLLLMAQALKSPWDVSDAACAVEMFHCASLIADDLPSMDNDDFRRGRPSVHKAYGEAVAIMASYALISEGYDAIYNNTMKLIEQGAGEAEYRGLLAVQNVAYNAGIDGATGGQFIDLKVKNPSFEQLEEILKKKTASIFEISSVLGWLFGGGDLKRLSEVKDFAFHLGMAFQILDDLDDLQQDDAKGAPQINFASHLGEVIAKARALDHLSTCRNLLIALNIDTAALLGILEQLENKAK
jgi:geranylgeranyl diphosphate synthase type II